jgi:diketogulonate reductase-like aldo/keto reductase
MSGIEFQEADLIAQRGNTVIPKSSTEARVKSNFELFELEKGDFDAIERITETVGQKRYGNLDPMWGSSLFENETL